MQHDVVTRAKEGIGLLEIWEPLGRQFAGPVVRRVHSLWFRGEEGCEFHVARADPQQRRVFAGAAPLHRCADHDDGKRDLHAVVDGGEDHGLRAAATRSGRGNPRRIDLGQTEKEVERADGIEGLEAHHALQVRLRPGAVESPPCGRVHLRTLLLEAVDESLRQLLRIGIAEHVPLPDHAAHAGQLHAQRLKPAAAALLKTLLSRRDLSSELLGRLLREPSVLPVAMGEEHAGHLSLRVHGPVEIAGHEKPRRALEGHLGDGVAVALDRAVDQWMKRCFFRHGPEPLRHENPPADVLGAGFPGLSSGGRMEGEGSVEVDEVTQTRIRTGLRGQRAGGQSHQEEERRQDRHAPPQRCSNAGLIQHGSGLRGEFRTGCIAGQNREADGATRLERSKI